jgi:hypothetical protein
LLALGAVASSSMFIAQMAFFNRVSDARIGGTYLTMLNTLANLGGQWPGTIVLALKGAINDTPGSAKGFYMVAVGSTLLGIAWIPGGLVAAASAVRRDNAAGRAPSRA